jgi:hypothetical protein
MAGGATPQREDSKSHLDQRKWVEELTKADERGARFRIQLEEAVKAKAEVEERLQLVEK